jgi:uncharacterized protein (TIGR01319 family)
MESETWLVTDCGSTTSKSIVFSNKDGHWQMVDWAVMPTTVEAPHADVTVGVLQTIEILKDRGVLSQCDGVHQFPERFLATSSAGGGLRVALIGLTKEITTACLHEAALHAGAIVTVIISLDDDDTLDKRLEKLRTASPDIVMLAAGFSEAMPAAFPELIALLQDAALRSRVDSSLLLPLIFAGSQSLEPQLKLLEKHYDLYTAAPIAPSSSKKNLLPTEHKVHQLFLESVMEHAPGYRKLLSEVSYPIAPTPVAVTKILEAYSTTYRQKLICIDMGGATTDVFSTGAQGIVRTVSSNIGMSYSSYYVFQNAGVAAFRKYLPHSITNERIEASIFNKMLRPTTIPDDPIEQQIEYALCRVGLELSHKAHLQIVKRADERQSTFSIDNIFAQNAERHVVAYDRVIASGGVFSHCPDPEEIPWMIADGLSLNEMTEIFVDAVFMLPHLGMLYDVRPEASLEILEQQCLQRIGIYVPIAVRDTLYLNGQNIAFDRKRTRQVLKFHQPILSIQTGRSEKHFSAMHQNIFLELTAR